MNKTENNAFNERKYLLDIIGLLARKELVVVGDLSNFNNHDVSDIMTACFNSSIDELIFDDVLAAKHEEATVIFGALEMLVTEQTINIRQIVELHKKFGIELGKFLMRTNREFYKKLQNKTTLTPREQEGMEEMKVYLDSVRAQAQLVMTDPDACLLLASLVKEQHLDLDGLKLIDNSLGDKAEEMAERVPINKKYIQQSNIDKSNALVSILVKACCCLGLAVDDISALHYSLGSFVGTHLLNNPLY